MIKEFHHKSSTLNGTLLERKGRKRLPPHGPAGLVLIAVSEILLLKGNHFVSVYFTPLVWSGYIIFIDALLKRIKGTSLITRRPSEFVLLLLLSIVSWLVFEGYNLLLRNWRYVGLPESRLPRYLGYAWSFATISPGIFFTYELISHLNPDTPPENRKRITGIPFYALTAAGLVSLVLPLAVPSPYMTPLVWVGFVLLLDPVNSRIGERSILAELFSGHIKPLLNLFLAGLFCGLLWEFWNYWATAKWQYNVPYLGDIRIFEMPVLGYLGFLPFAVECLAIYKFLRRMVPIPLGERYLG